MKIDIGRVATLKMAETSIFTKNRSVCQPPRSVKHCDIRYLGLYSVLDSGNNVYMRSHFLGLRPLLRIDYILFRCQRLADSADLSSSQGCGFEFCCYEEIRTRSLALDDCKFYTLTSFPDLIIGDLTARANELRVIDGTDRP